MTLPDPRQAVWIDDAAGSVEIFRMIQTAIRPARTGSGTPERRQTFRNLTCNLTCKHILEKRKEPKEKRN